MTDPRWVDEALDAIDQGWWESLEEADAREESEHGLEPVKQPWRPAWTHMRDRISYGRDPHNSASSAEPEERSW